jgi:hypothetical protein
MTPINFIFLAYVALAGLAIGGALIAKPELSELRVPPFFWLLIAMALFEFAAFARGQGAPGSTIRMEVRFLGFALAIGLMLALPYLAGSPVRLF